MSEEFPSDESSSQPRRKGLTPEQRRFLGTPRARDDEPETPAEPTPELAPARAPRTFDAPRPEPARSHFPGPVESKNIGDGGDGSAADESRPSGGHLKLDQKASRVFEMQRAVLGLGAVVLLALTFYVGLKFPYWKYRLYSSRNAPKLEESVTKKFPDLSSDELVEQALKAEREGNLKDAAERFLAAKYKNRSYRGILARVGRMAFDKQDFTTADKLFEQAIEFGENVDTANYFRGMIATRRKDMSAALRFFEAAAVAGPFVADYHYAVGDALRLDHRPREAMPRYEHAALIVNNDREAAVCRFKIRQARMEAGESSQVGDEIAAQQSAGKLSVDWLMTAAALSIREGKVDEAMPLIQLARDGDAPGVFGACVTDGYFIEAARTHPRLAQVCRPPGR